MVTFALSVAQAVLVQPWLWFTSILDATGMSGVFLAALVMVLSYKFLVAPIFGSNGASSDTAKKRSNGRR